MLVRIDACPVFEPDLVQPHEPPSNVRAERELEGRPARLIGLTYSASEGFITVRAKRG